MSVLRPRVLRGGRPLWRRSRLALATLLLILSASPLAVLSVSVGSSTRDGEPGSDRLDPAAWGADHVDQPVPDYITGDECLFCHRDPIGETWPENPHQRTVRPASDAPEAITLLSKDPRTTEAAVDVDYVLGETRMIRFLREAVAYGSFEMLETACRPERFDAHAALIHPDPAGAIWNPSSFNRDCAGCHATGVDPETMAVSDLGLDCYTCHGDSTLAHAADPSQMILAEARNDPPRVVASICGQCHIRTGTSRSTGRPFAANFVAGDNLFRDLDVDLSNEAIQRLGPGDGHVLQNIRAIVVEGREQVTCLSCHGVHQPETVRHHEVAEGPICLTCHEPDRPRSEPRPFEVHNRICGY